MHCPSRQLCDEVCWSRPGRRKREVAVLLAVGCPLADTAQSPQQQGRGSLMLCGTSHARALLASLVRNAGPDSWQPCILAAMHNSASSSQARPLPSNLVSGSARPDAERYEPGELCGNHLHWCTAMHEMVHLAADVTTLSYVADCLEHVSVPPGAPSCSWQPRLTCVCC